MSGRASVLKNLLLAALLAASAASAADFLPISAGNRWTYRSASGETFEIAVSATPIQAGEFFYYNITGYASQALFVRRGDSGVIYWLNEEQNREEVLTDFRPLAGAFYTTPISEPCEADAQAQEKPAVFEGPGGVFPDAREILYRISGCADTGIDSELYLDNIGLARRVVNTIAGPREFNLVSAKVGPLSFSEQPGAQFRLSMPSSELLRKSPGETVSTEITLRLSVDRLNPVFLRFPTSQRYDVAIKDEQGEVVYLWSSSAAFLQVVSEEFAVFLDYAVPLSLTLPDGNYQLEAWLTTDTRDRQFAATAPLSIRSVDESATRGQPVRSRSR